MLLILPINLKPSFFFLSLTCISTIVLSQSLVHCAKAKEAIEIAGVVSTIDGIWQAERDKQVKKLRRGSSIPDGWMLKRCSAEGRIVVIRSDGTEFVCPKQTRVCRCPISVKAPEDRVKNAFQGALKLFAENPDRWLSSTVRSGISVEDGVIEEESNTNIAHLTDGFRDESLSYKIFSLNDEQLKRGAVKLATNRFVIDTSELHQGVYKFACGDEDVRVNQTCAYLAVVPKSKFEKLSKLYAAAKKKVRNADGNSDKVKQGILRAYLSTIVTE